MHLARVLIPECQGRSTLIFVRGPDPRAGTGVSGAGTVVKCAGIVVSS